MQKYSLISRLLHWLVAGLIVSQYVLAELSEYAEDNEEIVKQLGLLANHKSIGMTIVMLAVLRLLWRIFNKPPALPSAMPVWQQRASGLAHCSLYGLIFAIPISGWLMSSATAYSVSWFNLFVFPDLVGPSESLAGRLHDVHELLAKLMFVLALVHIAAALKHHFIDKDQVLTRMASLGGWLLLLASIAIAVGVFGRIDTSKQSNVNLAVGLNESVGIEASDLPVWKIDYADSFIKFSGDQAGAQFVGLWQTWQGKIQFDSAQLDNSRFDVVVDVESVSSNDTERDGYIRSADFFDVETHKQVRFVADQFSTDGNGGFKANGRLTMKGVTDRVLLNFTVEENQGKLILLGNTTLDRFGWNIGMGDWSDTSWVGKDVMVQVRVVAQNIK